MAQPKGAERFEDACRQLQDNTATRIDVHYLGVALDEDNIWRFAKLLQANTSLQHLNYSLNWLDEHVLILTRALKTHVSLQTLHLRSNHAKNEGAEALADILKQNTPLLELDLSSNDIRDEGAIALAKALKINTVLQTLKLSTNGIENKGAMAFAEALETNTALQSLSLNANSIGSKGTHQLLSSLKRNNSLHLLSLGGNSMDMNGIRAFSDVLMANTALQSFRFNNGAVCLTCLRDENISFLAQALEMNTTLHCLALGNNKISETGTSIFAKILGNNSSLRELRLDNNNLGSKGVCELAKALLKNTSLQKLNLCWTKLMDEGAFALAEALERNSTLLDLDLFDNDITAKGAIALAEALKLNCSLHLLGIGLNPSIGDEGFRAMGETLCVNTSLRSLDMCICGGRDEGACFLAKSLLTNRTLRKLNISRNWKFGGKAGKAFAEVIGTNTTLQVLDIEGSKIGEKGVKACIRALENRNTTLYDFYIGSNGYDGKPTKVNEFVQSLLLRNRKIQEENASRRCAMLNHRRSFHAWRDRSRIFLAAREGRPMELRFRLKWGKLAGGLTLQGNCDGELMTPLEAARKRGHLECIKALMKTDS